MALGLLDGMPNIVTRELNTIVRHFEHPVSWDSEYLISLDGASGFSAEPAVAAADGTLYVAHREPAYDSGVHSGGRLVLLVKAPNQDWDPMVLDEYGTNGIWGNVGHGSAIAIEPQTGTVYVSYYSEKEYSDAEGTYPTQDLKLAVIQP